MVNDQIDQASGKCAPLPPALFFFLRTNHVGKEWMFYVLCENASATHCVPGVYRSVLSPRRELFPKAQAGVYPVISGKCFNKQGHRR